MQIIDNYFPEEVAKQLELEFPPYDSPVWHTYDNPLENKKTCNNWNAFPPLTYRTFQELTLCTRYIPDLGLHGGGWHIHSQNGNLNPHLDYSIHPKLKLQRYVNLIVYLSSNLLPEHGGWLGFWKDGTLVKEIEPLFNRAVIFETSNTWHGMSRPLICPPDVYRKSIAIYYLIKPTTSEKRERALFAPREEQKNDAHIREIIKNRSGPTTSGKAYITK